MLANPFVNVGEFITHASASHDNVIYSAGLDFHTGKLFL